MRLELLAKVNGSGRTGCPSVLLELERLRDRDRRHPAHGECADHRRSADDQAVVWSNTIDAETAAAVPNHLPGESGVRIPMQVILDAADAYRARQAR